MALTIAYDGTDFLGSQIQSRGRTVQAEVERALAGLYGVSTGTVFAGRTDRGVHAAGQVVGCRDERPSLPTGKIRAALNARLPEDVAVLDVERRVGFHARFDARWREYRYRVWCGERQPLARRHVWQRRDALDLAAMDEAAARLIGEHDFASLAGGGEGVPWSERRQRPRGTVRRVLCCRCVEIPARWGADGGGGQLIELRVVADGFLPQMVRNIASLLVDVGRGAEAPDRIGAVITARDRRAAGGTAPAQGLTLWRVGYGDEAVGG